LPGAAALGGDLSGVDVVGDDVGLRRAGLLVADLPGDGLVTVGLLVADLPGTGLLTVGLPVADLPASGLLTVVPVADLLILALAAAGLRVTALVVAALRGTAALRGAAALRDAAVLGDLRARAIIIDATTPPRSLRCGDQLGLANMPS
jgi:hypothetical protein